MVALGGAGAGDFHRESSSSTPIPALPLAVRCGRLPSPRGSGSHASLCSVKWAVFDCPMVARAGKSAMTTVRRPAWRILAILAVWGLPGPTWCLNVPLIHRRVQRLSMMEEGKVDPLVDVER
jgi:hypothetical protein